MTVELVPLTDHLFLVLGENGGRFPRAHSFYVRDETCALVDTGCGVELLRELRREHRVDLVINSHGHPDHSAGNWLFPDVPVWAPEQGRETHGRLQLLSHRFAEPGELAQTWRKFIRPMMNFRDHLPSDWFGDGHVFDFGTQRLRAIHAPGHTADHYVFFDERDGVLLPFDIDLTPFGPWYGHRESDLTQLRGAIDRAEGLGARLVASSHREPLRDDAIAPAFASFAGALERRAEAIRELTAGGATLAELAQASPIYGGVPPYAQTVVAYWEGKMIAMHLAELEATGAVRRDGERWWRVP